MTWWTGERWWGDAGMTAGDGKGVVDCLGW